MSDDEIIDNLHREIAHLQTNNWRLENENVALATANSELRSQLIRMKDAMKDAAEVITRDSKEINGLHRDIKELKALLRSVTHD